VRGEGDEVMSWAESVLSVWQWGKEGLATQYDIHLRPDCQNCKTISTLPLFPPASTTSPTPSSSSLSSLSSAMPRTSPLVRLAGLSGALAIGLGAYGAHSLAGQEVAQERTKAFEVANRYHLIHSAALLGLPLAHRPRLAGALMVGGMAVFCGTCYYHALTGDRQFRQFTPYGGMMLILAWLAAAL